MRGLSTRTAGLLLVILGIWGAIIPFVGPAFHYPLGPDKTWTWTMDRLYLDVLPGVAAFLGGLMLIAAGSRPAARLGALLALAGGIWFVIGPDLSHLWNAAGAQGAGHGSVRLQMWESLGYHTALGVLIAALAAYVLPRFPAVAGGPAAPGYGRRRGVAAPAAGAAGSEAGAARERPVAGATPAGTRGGVPVAEGASAGEGAPAGEPAPTAEGARAAGDAPAAGGAPATRGAPAGEPAPAADRAPVADSALVAGNAPAVGRASERAPAAGGSPAGNRTVAAGQPVGDGGGQATREEPVAGPPAAGNTAQYRQYPRTVRRRRGGLLSKFTRR